MSDTSDTPPHIEPTDLEETEAFVDPHFDDEDEEPESIKTFAFLAVALLVMVGASVFFVGTLLNNDAETAAAEADANALVEGFESGAIGATETPPETLPLVR